jgi:type II secretory pathway pseudopilin PulG
MRRLIFKYKKSKESGFTLIELLIYAALFVVIGAVASAFFIQIVNVTETSRRSRESLDNARRAMGVIVQEVKHATNVYTPTSTLGTHPGQLSLETTRDLPTDENTTYVDVYLDDDRIYLKRESQTVELLNSEKVKVTNLVFTHLNGGGNSAVQVNLTVEYSDQFTGPKTPVTLSQTASLRSY